MRRGQPLAPPGRLRQRGIQNSKFKIQNSKIINQLGLTHDLRKNKTVRLLPYVAMTQLRYFCVSPINFKFKIFEFWISVEFE
jgi:hypothetical protein